MGKAGAAVAGNQCYPNERDVRAGTAISNHRRTAPLLVVSVAEGASRTIGHGCRLDPLADRSLHLGSTGGPRPAPGGARGPAHLTTPCHVRPYRLAADAGRSGCLP